LIQINNVANDMGGNMMGESQAGKMGPGMMSSNMMMGQMGSGTTMTDMMMRGRSGSEHIEGRLAYIKTELKITDAQTAQWNAFADAARANAKAMSEIRGAMMSRQAAPATLPERLALEDKAATAHLEALKKAEEAADKLYSVLTEEQKKAADSIIIGPMGMPMGMM
jgi:LTXXQ motif family protein